MQTSTAEPQVIFEEWSAAAGRIGVARLNHSRALNSLTLEMVRALAEQLGLWERDPRVSLVVIHSGSERAFCAGGDVKTVAQKLIAQDKAFPAEFFRWEYKMDYMIRTFAKPILVWGDGIVMGGGLGIFCGASHPIATERSLLAMPEITIGFFSDVGAGYFLNRLPRGLGLFLGWTAARLTPWDALHLGLACDVLSSGSKEDVFSRLRDQAWVGEMSSDSEQLQRILEHWRVTREPSHLQRFEATICEVLAVEDVSSARSRFLALEISDVWWQACRNAHLAGSPLSAHIIFEQLRRERDLGVLDIFLAEWSLASRMCERPEFPEGVRALLIDKDQRPRWQPERFEDVTTEQVQSHFIPDPGIAETRQFFLAR
ncbi:MAG: enoyl-CoA hydratase/isomerase family protein [Bdellovibrionaceae bacterium]|nr:enoyl-CoA hydratase/isomerase family protein [Pseudobdellovibrionaceae bacterium]